MGLASIGLYMPKNLLNVGATLRAADCYNADLVVSQGRRYRDMPTDTGKSYRNIPFIHGVKDLFDYIPHGSIPVAVDIVPGATPLNKFVHPKQAFYIFGPEDGTLGKKVLDRCKYKVYVPTRICMNLGSAVNVVLYDRAAKEANKISYYDESSI